jgi:hypothetical protein
MLENDVTSREKWIHLEPFIGDAPIQHRRRWCLPDRYRKSASRCNRFFPKSLPICQPLPGAGTPRCFGRIKAEHAKTVEITKKVFSYWVKKRAEGYKCQRRVSSTREKPRIERQSDLQIHGARAKSRKRTPPVVGKKPYGKSQFKRSQAAINPP